MLTLQKVIAPPTKLINWTIVLASRRMNEKCSCSWKAHVVLYAKPTLKLSQERRVISSCFISWPGAWGLRLGHPGDFALSLSILKQSWQKLELTIASCIICNHGSSWDLSRESPSGGSDW